MLAVGSQGAAARQPQSDRVYRIGIISASIGGKPQLANGHTWHFVHALHPTIDQDAVKNAYFLLGEAANLRADVDTAHGYFERLQTEFFPDQPYLSSLLLSVDVRKLVNLHA